MKSNPEIRQEVRRLITGKWNAGALVVFIFAIFQVVSSLLQGSPEEGTGMMGIAMIYTLLVLYPLNISCAKIFLDLAREGETPDVGQLFYAFRKPLYGKAVLLQLLTVIFTLLWTLLLIVPGIIKGLSYSMAPYILLDNPELTPIEAINKSQEMMRGHKMDLFLMQLGFVGWILLSFLTLGIAFFWVGAYYDTVFAKFYMELKEEMKN